MTDQPGLVMLGWREAHAAAFDSSRNEGRIGARVVAEERGQYTIHDGTITRQAAISGRLRHDAQGDPRAYPSVGDWVVASVPLAGDLLTIHALLPRHSLVTRHAPTDHTAPVQVIAANVDVVFIVASLNAELNLRRLERYLAVVWESGATPVVILSKADLDTDQEIHRSSVEAVAPGVEVIITSSISGSGIEAVRAHLAPGRTVAFIGSSGVGKSTLVNALAGYELLTTAGIREDDARGRHTTTRRQLVTLVDGLVIDTPGMRELALLDGDGLASTFDDIEQVARRCRFGDCRHASEPGCAVLAEIDAGVLDRGRFGAFLKLEGEARRSELANDAVARKADRRKWSVMARDGGRARREKYGDDR